jgi:WD40 repeat protein
VVVFSLAISLDGRELAAGLPLGKLAIWNLDGSKPTQTREIGWTQRYNPWSASQPLKIVYSPDGLNRGSAGPGGLFRVERRSTNDLCFALSGRGIAPTSAAWSPNGAILVTVSNSNEVMLWKTGTWQGQRLFGGPLSVVRALAFSGDGAALAVATDPCAALAMETSHQLGAGPNVRLPLIPLGTNHAKSPSPTIARDYIPWQSTTDTLRFFNVANSAEQNLLEPLPTLTALPCVAWSSIRRSRAQNPAVASPFSRASSVPSNSHNFLAAASRDGSVWVWEMQSRKLVAHLFLDQRIRKEIDAARTLSPALVSQDALPRDAAAPQLAFSPDGSRLAACDCEGTIRIWDSKDWHFLRGPAEKNADAKVLVYSPDGASLAVNNRGQIKLLDSVSGRIRIAIGETGGPAICCGQFSPDGRLLALGAVDGNVRFIDTVTGRVQAILVGHVDAVVALDFSPDGRTLATGSWDTKVRLWDVITRREVAVLDGHRGRVLSVAFSPNGTVLASGGEIDDNPEPGQGELFLWRTADAGKLEGTSLKGK